MTIDRKLLREIQRRVEANENRFDLGKYCFDKQLEFVNDPAKFKTAVCSRRAGKSVSCAADLINTALTFPKTTCAYITLSRITAKRIIWRQLLDIVKEFNIQSKPDHTDLSLQFANGSVIYVSGAKDETEVEKFRGLALKKVYVDEAQSFRPYIEKLIDDVIVPALYDYDGSLALIGTPGPVPAGFFFEASHSAQWSNHKWTMLDNPWIKKKSGREPAEILADERKRRGIDESDATYRRESLGEWVHDTDALVFKFDPSKNLYKVMPQGKFDYVFGIDLGWNDADSISVLAIDYDRNKVYLVDEDIQSKQNITQLVGKISALRDKYNPIKMVLDAGALGKKIQEEILARHQLPLVAADKARKVEFIELFNDDLRTGKFQAFDGSRFEQDSYLIQWDRSRVDKLTISDRYHSDAADSTLYAWRECRHYIASDARPKPKRAYTQEYADHLEQLDEERAARKAEKPFWDDTDDPSWDDLT